MDSLLEWEDGWFEQKRCKVAKSIIGTHYAGEGVCVLEMIGCQQTGPERTEADAKAWHERHFARRLMEVPAVRELVEAGAFARTVLGNIAEHRDEGDEMAASDGATRLDKALGVFGGLKDE